MNPRLLWLFALLALCCAQLALPAIADDDDYEDGDEWTVTFATAFESDYVWRGINVHDDFSIQPELLIQHDSGIWLDVWGEVDTSDQNGAEWDFLEVDYSLGFDWSSDCGWDVTVGGVHYTYPAISGDIETTELFGEVTYNFDPFSPYVGAYFDVDLVEGYYLYAGLSHTFREKHEPTVDMWLGYGDENHNDYYFGEDVDGPVDFNVDLSMNFVLTENWMLSPHIAYTALVDEDVSGEFIERDFWHGGMTAFYTWD